MNYIQRISEYKRKNYFQINTPFLDLYTGAINEWSQNLDVVKDILSFASSLDLYDQYELLNVRFIGQDISEDDKNLFMQTALTANQLLADELGESETWASIKPEGAPKRHFLTIVLVPSNKNKTTLDEFEIKDESSEQPKRKTRTVRPVSDDSESV